MYWLWLFGVLPRNTKFEKNVLLWFNGLVACKSCFIHGGCNNDFDDRSEDIFNIKLIAC